MANRRNKKINENGGSYTDYQFRLLCRIFDFRCVKCGKQTNLAADHITPVDWGGSSNIDNIQPLCEHCNSVKGNNEAIDYRESFYKKFKPLNSKINLARKNMAIAIFLEEYGDGYTNNIISLWGLNTMTRGA